jgi:hypothetical protein
VLLFGGADPLDKLRGNFLLAEPSPVDQVVTPGPLTVAGIAIEVVPLFGHSPGQVGYRVDGVFFCADVVLPATVLAKYRPPYLYSVTDHLRALAPAGATPCAAAVPGHGPVLDSLADLVDRNRSLVEAVAARVVELARWPATAEAILTSLVTDFGAAVTDAPGYYLSNRPPSPSSAISTARGRCATRCATGAPSGRRADGPDRIGTLEMRRPALHQLPRAASPQGQAGTASRLRASCYQPSPPRSPPPR